jgi:hypothetical protein
MGDAAAPSANSPWRRIMSWDVAIRGALIGGACAIVAAIIALAPSFLGSQATDGHGEKSAAAPILATAQLPPPSAGFNGVWVLPRTYEPQYKRELSRLGMAVSGWAPRYGGVYVGSAESGTYVLTLTGKARDGVTITDLGIRIIARRPARTGTLICVLPQGGNPDIGLSLNLRSPKSDPTISGENRLSGKPFFAVKNITLAKDESITLTTTFSAGPADYLFDLVGTVVVDGKVRKTLISGPNGRPFDVTGFASQYNAIFEPTSTMTNFMYVPPNRFSRREPVHASQANVPYVSVSIPGGISVAD